MDTDTFIAQLRRDEAGRNGPSIYASDFVFSLLKRLDATSRERDAFAEFHGDKTDLIVKLIAAEGELATLKRVLDMTAKANGAAIAAGADESDALRAKVAQMKEALEQCKEYLASSLGSTSEINPYPAIEAALNEAQPRW